MEKLISYKILIFSSLFNFIILCNFSFALYINADQEENWLKKHKFLIYEPCNTCNTQAYKNLSNNRILNFSYNLYLPRSIDKETISILQNLADNKCRTEAINFLDKGDYFELKDCFEPLDNISFLDIDNPQLLKTLDLIYGKNSEIHKDIKNAKLLKKGFRYYAIVYENKEILENPKRVKLDKPIEQRIYSGKKFYYVTSYYGMTIMSKLVSEGDVYHENFPIEEFNWQEDFKLKNKINEEIKDKKINEDKKKDFNF